MKRFLSHALASAVLVSSTAWTTAQVSTGTTLTVDPSQAGAPLNPRMWGVFFEDINYAGDGGLYPERVKNRSFEFTEPLMGWREVAKGGAKGTAEVADRQPLNPHNPHYLRLEVADAGDGFGLANDGFFGMGIQAGAAYTFSVLARAPQGEAAALTAEVVDSQGQILDRAVLRVSGVAWKRYAKTLRAKITEPKARLELLVTQPGTIELDMVSLYPRDTWKGRRNGLRRDLVQLLADLKPGFLRFPGGCIVEGRYLSTRYQWKTTIGDLAERKLIVNRWNDEFKHRPAPDYFQSFGLGFFEYFQLCEDIGAEPLPILNCGMACQFNSGELVPLGELDPFIQDAVDLVEFANGPSSSPWGARRAAMGHAKPFGMRLLGVGNEQWGSQYIERYARFAQVLKARYPEIQLVSSAGPSPADDRFKFLWAHLRELKADIVDEHCYAEPEWFFHNTRRYDGYDRSGPRVFMGEYAAQSVKVVSPENRNNWKCALAEAAFMTGLERNGDVVVMSAYAPLSAHVEGWQWTPNLIWFDNLRSYATPNYYVQQLYSRNRGTRLLPFTLHGVGAGDDLQASVVLAEPERQVVIKLVNSAASARAIRLQLADAGVWGAKGQATVLASDDFSAENSLDCPTRVAPVTSALQIPQAFTYELRPRSFTVLRLPVK